MEWIVARLRRGETTKASPPRRTGTSPPGVAGRTGRDCRAGAWTPSKAWYITSKSSAPALLLPPAAVAGEESKRELLESRSNVADVASASDAAMAAAGTQEGERVSLWGNY